MPIRLTQNSYLSPARSAIFAALLLIGLRGAAAEPSQTRTRQKDWIKLMDCRYVPADYNDGDSFLVKSGTNDFIVRLYFVDAPEASMRYPERVREQSEYFGVTWEETTKAGATAKMLVAELLHEPFVIWTRWASAAGRSKQPRYYAIVEADGTTLAELLVSRGLARTKGVVAKLPTGERSKAFKQKLERLEEEAKKKRVGIWAGSKRENADQIEK